jgi:hypothetical protein
VVLSSVDATADSAAPSAVVVQISQAAMPEEVEESRAVGLAVSFVFQADWVAAQEQVVARAGWAERPVASAGWQARQGPRKSVRTCVLAIARLAA